MMPWVLVDFQYLCHRAMHSVGNLEFEDMPTGVIFGFFHQLRQVCMDRRIRSNKVAIFCDSKISLRKKTYPKYKWKREAIRTPEEVERLHIMHQQADELSGKILPEIGFPVYSQEGLESDDLIAQAAINLSLRADFCNGVIVTADGDLYQCINSCIHWFDPARDVYHTEESFRAKEGIDAQWWGQVKILAGCETDNVEGIRGIGKKTAIKYLLEELPPTRKAHQDIVSTAGQSVVRRNYPLVVLPHKATKPLVLYQKPYNPEAFFRYCKKYGLLSFLQQKPAWESFFHGTPFRMRKRGES